MSRKLEPDFALFQKITKFIPLHFQKMQKHTQKLLNHTRIKLAQRDTSYRPGKPLGTTTKLEKDQTLVIG